MGYPPMKSSVTEDELVRLETRHKPMKYPRRTKEVCGWDSRLWPCDVAILVAALRASPVADTAGIDAERLMEAMNEAFTYEDCDNAQPTLPFFDDVEAFWTPFAAKVAAEYATLRTPKPEGER